MTDKQLALQEAILLAVHPGCTIEQAREKELCLGSTLIHKKYGECMLLKYVRTGSSSSEGYDGKKIQPGELVFSDYRTGIMKCVIKQTREIITVDSGEDNEAVNAESIQEVFDIIGLPATLERTLVALGDRYIYKECSLVAMIVYDEPIEGEKCYFVEIPRKLLNENGTPCDLFQQDISTQDTIYSILCKDEATRPTK